MDNLHRSLFVPTCANLKSNSRSIFHSITNGERKAQRCAGVFLGRVLAIITIRRAWS